jgi:hypothetical protein
MTIADHCPACAPRWRGRPRPCPCEALVRALDGERPPAIPDPVRHRRRSPQPCNAVLGNLVIVVCIGVGGSVHQQSQHRSFASIQNFDENFGRDRKWLSRSRNPRCRQLSGGDRRRGLYIANRRLSLCTVVPAPPLPQRRPRNAAASADRRQAARKAASSRDAFLRP